MFYRDILFSSGYYVEAEKANQILEDVLKCLVGKGISIAAAKEILKEAELELDGMKIV